MAVCTGYAARGGCVQGVKAGGDKSLAQGTQPGQLKQESGRAQHRVDTAKYICNRGAVQCFQQVQVLLFSYTRPSTNFPTRVLGLSNAMALRLICSAFLMLEADPKV